MIMQLIRMTTLFIAILFNLVGYAATEFQGKITSVPPNIQQLMKEGTWRPNCPIPIKDLSYIQISYWGFDNQVHQGEIIVHQQVAAEVLDIFKQLFTIHFPIQQVEIPEKLAHSQKLTKPFDLLLYAVNANDTYGFFCREDTQTPGRFSAHSWGLAIDINPFYNPMAGSEEVAKMQKGRLYLNRNLKHIGMISAGDPLFNIFTEYGWQWGGFFEKGADYMHFEKLIKPHYMVEKLKYVPDSEQISNLYLLK
jgi:D-alanyl-D-alanine carboxypeptidase-like protein